MATKLDLEWGDQTLDILLDLRTRSLLGYGREEAAAKVHGTYGGRNYYRSCSGMSGAGWIPAHPALRRVGAYRVDRAQGPEFSRIPETLPGIRVVAPINWREGEIATNFPVAVFRNINASESEAGTGTSYERLCLVDSYGLELFLLGKEEEFEELDITVRYVPTPWSEPTDRVFPVRVRKGVGCPGYYRRAIVHLFNRELALWTGGEEDDARRPETNRFWSRLGFREFEGDLLKVAQSVCWGRHTREALSTVEALQAVAPANVAVLTPTLYVQEVNRGQEWERGFEAVGLFQIDGEEVEFELYLESLEAGRAMAGDFAAIAAKLEEGARGKAEQARKDSLRQEQLATEQAEKNARFRELCEQHAELEVSIEDSLAAGNCRPGTEDFRDKHFTSRNCVKVGELVRFLPVAGVRRVLEHMLLPLAVPVPTT